MNNVIYSVTTSAMAMTYESIEFKNDSFQEQIVKT